MELLSPRLSPDTHIGGYIYFVFTFNMSIKTEILNPKCVMNENNAWTCCSLMFYEKRSMWSPLWSFPPSAVLLDFLLRVCACVCVGPLDSDPLTDHKALLVKKAGTVENTTWVSDLMTIRWSLTNCPLQEVWVDVDAHASSRIYPQFNEVLDCWMKNMPEFWWLWMMYSCCCVSSKDF